VSVKHSKHPTSCFRRSFLNPHKKEKAMKKFFAVFAALLVIGLITAAPETEAARSRCGVLCKLRSARVQRVEARQSKASPDQSKPDQAKPDQVKPAKVKGTQVALRIFRRRRASPDQAKPDQAKPDQAKPTKARNRRVRSLFTGRFTGRLFTGRVRRDLCLGRRCG